MSLRRNTAWNMAGNGLPLVAGAAAVPFLISHLGTEQFCILTLIWAIIGYLSIFDFGLGRALTQLTAKNAGACKGGDNVDLLKTAVFLTTIAGLIGAGVLLALAYPLAVYWLNVTDAHQVATFHALVITALAIPVTTVSASFRGVLEGLERFRETNIARVVLGLSTFLFPVIAIALGGTSLRAVAASLVMSRVVNCAILLTSVVQAEPRYSFSLLPHNAHRAQLLRFGSWMTVSNLISPLMVNADRFVISGTLGASIVAYYTVPFELITRLLIIPSAIGSSLFPRLAACPDPSDAQVRRLVRRAALISGGVVGVTCAMLVAGYVPVASIWISSDFANASYGVAAILAVGTLVNGVAYVLYTAVQAHSGAKATGLLHGAELVLYVPVLLLCVQRMGILGAAVAWTLRTSLDCLVLAVLYRRGAKKRPQPFAAGSGAVESG